MTAPAAGSCFVQVWLKPPFIGLGPFLGYEGPASVCEHTSTGRGSCLKSQVSSLAHCGSLCPGVLLAPSLAVSFLLHPRAQPFLSLQDLCKDPVTLMFTLPASAVCSLPS